MNIEILKSKFRNKRVCKDLRRFFFDHTLYRIWSPYVFVNKEAIKLRGWQYVVEKILRPIIRKWLG